MNQELQQRARFGDANIVNGPIATGVDAYAAWQKQVQAELAGGQ